MAAAAAAAAAVVVVVVVVAVAVDTCSAREVLHHPLDIMGNAGAGVHAAVHLLLLTALHRSKKEWFQ